MKQRDVAAFGQNITSAVTTYVRRVGDTPGNVPE
jgi:hypothetical protein